MKLAAILIVSLAACASNDDSSSQTTSKQDAKKALTSATSSIGGAEKQSASFASAVHVTAPCVTSGTVTLDGSHDVSTDGLHQQYDLDAAFAGCQTADGKLDGELHFKTTIDSGNFTAQLSGDISWDGENDAVSCAFDLEAEVSATKQSLTGTVCGYDLAELDVDIDDLKISLGQ